MAPITYVPYGEELTFEPHVVFTDEVGVKHDALLTQVWSRDEEGPVVANLVFVVADPQKSDPYGHQIERRTSVSRRNEYSAHGFFFELA